MHIDEAADWLERMRDAAATGWSVRGASHDWKELRALGVAVRLAKEEQRRMAAREPTLAEVLSNVG